MTARVNTAAGGWVFISPDPDSLEPRIWLQPNVMGAQMTLSLSPREARELARELNLAAHAIEPKAVTSC